MPEDRRLTISTSSRTSPDEVARRTFATARRGFDPAEVRAYLEMVAREMLAAAEREEQWRDAVEAAERRAANPVLDENTLTAALGQETARVLRTVHDAAAELLARAEGDAGRLRSHAQEEADQVQAHAEQNATDRAAQAEASAGDVRRRANEEAKSRLEGARLEAEALVAQARAEGRAMVQEAQELRARVLADLSRRRRVLHSQIEQLRAGRERLAATISDVRHSVDRITDELFRAEDEARLAAEAAGRQAASQEDSDELERASAGEPVGAAAVSGIVAGDEIEVVESVVVIPNPAGTHPTDDVAAEGDSGAQGPNQAVEDLFARLRAERGPDAQAGPGEAVLAQKGHTAGDQAKSDPGPAPEAPAAPAPGSGGTHIGAAEKAAAGDDAEAAEAGAANDDEEEADPHLARRAELLEPVVTGLSRRLKRALQDDQNDILDRLRGGRVWGPDVLADEDEQLQRYVKAALDPLAEAASAGIVFAGAGAGAKGGGDAPQVHAVAEELAAAIVTPLRRRLQQGESIDAGDESALVERVGAAFREWKGARIERLAGDHAVAAFSLATLSALSPRRETRWVVDDDGMECPDCDDNALAGAVAGGEEFPTGHVHPPAHAGCRCLLVPVDA